MFRSFFHIVKGRRANSAVVENASSVPVVGISQERESHQQEIICGLFNAERSALAPLREGRHTGDNHTLVEVDLLPVVYSGGIIEDACKVQLKVVGTNYVADWVNSDLRGTGEASTSTSQIAGSFDKSCTGPENSTDQQHQLQHHNITITVQIPPTRHNSLDPCKALDSAFPRTISGFSTDSMAEHCRICQLTTEEPLMELGCLCRGELAKAHRTCIQQWFDNKGTNKCEVCRHVAANLPAPAAQPLHNFWAWGMSRSYGQGVFRRWQQGTGRFHPLLAALLILVTGLMADVLISYYLGASALPLNIIIGVLVVLGLVAGGSLIMECCHERSMRRSIQTMERAADLEHFQSSEGATPH